MFNSWKVNSNAFLAPSPGKGEIARMRLLEAAVEVFGEKGLKGATVREIAKHAGQNVAAIKYYYGGKQELYRAVVEGIVRELRYHLKDAVEKTQRERDAGMLTPQKAVQLLQAFIRSIYLGLLSRRQMLSISRVIMREQTQPTAAFNILYENVFKEIHETISFLVGCAIGTDAASRETILRAHSVMGQIWFFAIARETILRRLGWDDLGGKNAEWVTEIVTEQVQILLSGLRTKIKESHS